MAERRYITRARAQAGDVADTSTTNPSTFRSTRSTSSIGKRKALAESTLALENSRSQPDNQTRNLALTTRVTRSTKSAVKRPVTRSRTTGHSSGLSATPRRSGRNAHVKKVTFANPEDKENVVPCNPPVTPQKEKSKHLEETDEFMSTSMGALSVKPKRVPRSKLAQPSTGIFAEPLPALSPRKARRPKRAFDPDDKELEDELLCPTSPRLQERPRRPMISLGRTNIEDGTDLLMSSRDTLKPPALLGSPARRFLQPPSKLRECFSLDLPLSPSKSSGLATPPRRNRKQGMGPTLSMPLSKSVVKGSPLKFSITNTMDASNDPFSDPSTPLTENHFFQKPGLERKLLTKQDPSPAKLEEAFDMVKAEMKAKSPEATESDLGSTIYLGADVSTARITPPSKLNGPVIPPTDSLKCHAPTKSEENVSTKKEDGVEADSDGDISMGDISEPARLVLTSMAPETVLVRKYSNPSEGGSSFGLFDFGGEDEDDDMGFDSENVPPLVVVTNLASELDGIDLDRQNRGFGQEIDLSTKESSMCLFDDVPVDPMLLSEDISDVVIGYSEILSPTTRIPVKFHSDSDDVFGNDTESRDGGTVGVIGSGLPQPDKESRRGRRSNGFSERTGGVLAGAVVYVDAYTNDGANCGENFEKILKGMGAKVLKQWAWNPDALSPGKVGITHVVFKDGSPRILQKVKATKGLVSCVALAWVIQCARQDEWLDESAYSVDLNDVPHGGHKRHKSMEPQKMDELLSQLTSAPRERRKTSLKTVAPKTPQRQMPSQLIPRTEPPKFDLSTVNPFLIERIRIARRQSMQFAPKIGSPLVKSWSLAE